MENAAWQKAKEPDSPGINKLIRADVDKCVAVVMMRSGGTQASVSHTHNAKQLHMKLQQTVCAATISTLKLVIVFHL